MSRKSTKVQIGHCEYDLTQIAASEAITIPLMLLKVCPVNELLSGNFKHAEPDELRLCMLKVLHKTENVKFCEKIINVDEHFDNDLSGMMKLFIEVVKFNFADFFLEAIPFLADQVSQIQPLRK